MTTPQRIHPPQPRRRAGHVSSGLACSSALLRGLLQGLLCGVFLGGCLVATSAVAAHGDGRFTFGEVAPLAPAERFAPWADMMQRRAAEPSSLEACLAARPQEVSTTADAMPSPLASSGADADPCPVVLRGARHVVLRARGLDTRQRLELVNRFVNRRRYVDHLDARRWQTLLGFLRRGGDCEDYAVAKYFVLRAVGVPARDLRVVVGRTRRSGGHHALLAVRGPDGRVLLLDTDDRIHAGERPGDYDFLYSVNEIGVWDHAADPAALATAHLDAPATHEEEAHAR
jgi:predicted transglutaminase-like cysteine proteinase